MANFTGNTALLIAAPMLQDYFVDKTTGLPLAAGVVTFWQDNARHTLLKNVYYQVDSGTTPPAYTYSTLPNPLTLSASGTIVDANGNDVIPFFYPYSENINDPPNTSQAYYIEVYNSNNVLQFTRSNFPFVPPADNTTNTSLQNLINLIPNGQFLSHNNLPDNSAVVNGTAKVSAISTSTTSDTTNTSVIIAQGGAVGWYFIKNQNSTSTDVITFASLVTEPLNLTGNPRYAVDIQCTATGTDALKELRVRFNNVNRFATSQKYTIGLSGFNVNGGTVNLPINYIKYFGAAGSTRIDNNVATFTLNNASYKAFSGSFSFDVNSATIDQNGGDYVEIAIRLPAQQPYHIRLTDIILTPGDIDITTYPERPDHEVLDKALAGSVIIPDPAGNDLYLPLVLTPGGAIFDHSSIGKIEAAIYTTANKGELLCDGSTYKTAGYSTDGIPYARLQKVLFSNGVGNIPQHGTGSDFATCYIPNSSPTLIYISNNKFGTGDFAQDNNTGFVFTHIHANTTTTYNVNAYRNGVNTGILKGAITAIADTGATGIAFTYLRTGVSNNYNIVLVDTSGVGIGVGLASKYFTYTSNSVSYYVWFKFNGTGTDPAPGGTGIEIDVWSSINNSDLANVVIAALNGGANTLATVTAPASITAGTWFGFQTATGNKYYVWYFKNGGTDPAPLGYTFGIKVDISTSVDAAAVALATQIAINSTYYGVPNYQGMFLRGYDPASTWDIDAAMRFGVTGNQVGNVVGTYELDQFFSHIHGLPQSALNVPSSAGTSTYINLGSAANTLPAGGTETRPVNANVNWFIRY